MDHLGEASPCVRETSKSPHRERVCQGGGTPRQMGMEHLAIGGEESSCLREETWPCLPFSKARGTRLAALWSWDGIAHTPAGPCVLSGAGAC